MADETTENLNRTVYTGRRRILAAPAEITADNVVDAINDAMLVHAANAGAERYLHNYFLGHQPVLNRNKPVRPEINNAVVENRAYQFVKDRTDALAGEPITYTARGIGRKDASAFSSQLNGQAKPGQDADEQGVQQPAKFGDDSQGQQGENYYNQAERQESDEEKAEKDDASEEQQNQQLDQPEQNPDEQQPQEPVDQQQEERPDDSEEPPSDGSDERKQDDGDEPPADDDEQADDDQSREGGGKPFQPGQDGQNQQGGNVYSFPRSDDDDGGISDKVQRLNDCCVACDKHASDLELVQWMMEVGVGYRLILPTKEIADSTPEQKAEMPFRVATLDPRSTCVVYSNDAFHEPLYAINEVIDPKTHDITRTLYTATQRFVVTYGVVVESGDNPLGMIPIIEYQANPERMGIFEAVLSLFDAINEVESNRVDGISQFVQSLMVLTNVDIDEDEYKRMLKLGAVKIDSQGELPASVDLLTAELNQDQTQTLVDNFYKTALSICGMPFNVGGSASTSDTGAAVTMRDGWSNSESRCKETEAMFKRSERKFLEAALKILDVSEHLDLKSNSVEIKFTRRNYEAVQSKAQVLTTLLGCGQIHPRLAFQASDLFPDTEDAYDQSMQYAQDKAAQSVAMFQQRQSIALGGGNGDDEDEDGKNRFQGGGIFNKSADSDNGKGASGNGSRHGDATPVNKA